MTRLAVFIPTTHGPALIERVTVLPRLDQSLVCRGKSSDKLGHMSHGYDAFVKPGTGVIARAFPASESGAYRLDVSGDVDRGDSWQLAAFLAHAIREAPDHQLAETEETADAVLWATGRVQYDYTVGAVESVGEKSATSRSAFERWAARGLPVFLLVPGGRNFDELQATGPPPAFEVHGIEGVWDACRQVGLKPGAAAAATVEATDRAEVSSTHSLWPRRLAWAALALLLTVAVVAGVTARRTWSGWDAMAAVGDRARLDESLRAAHGGGGFRAVLATAYEAWFTIGVVEIVPLDEIDALAPAMPEAVPTDVAAPVDGVTSTGVSVPTEVPTPTEVPIPTEVPTPTEEPAAAEDEEPAAALHVSVAVYERRAPAGSRCASVFFGSAEAVEVAVPAMADGLLEPSPSGRACGLTFTVEVPGAPRHVGFVLDVESGTFLDPSSAAVALDGAAAFTGRRAWSIDFPHVMAEPFVYRLLVVSASAAVADETAWLREQADPEAAAASLLGRDLEVAVIRHTVER